MSNRLRFFQNLLALSAVTLLITVWATVSFLVYQNSLFKRNSISIQPLKQTTSPQIVENIDDWKTYTNEKYGFELEYPSNWIINQEIDAYYEFVWLSPPKVLNNNPSDQTGNIKIKLYKNDPIIGYKTNPEKIFQNFMNSCSLETPTSCDQKIGDDYKFEKQIAIAGIPAFQTYGGCCMDIGRRVYMYHNTDSLEFILYNLGSYTSTITNEEIFSQILSTFRFLD